MNIRYTTIAQCPSFPLENPLKVRRSESQQAYSPSWKETKTINNPEKIQSLPRRAWQGLPLPPPLSVLNNINYNNIIYSSANVVKEFHPEEKPFLSAKITMGRNARWMIVRPSWCLTCFQDGLVYMHVLFTRTQFPPPMITDASEARKSAQCFRLEDFRRVLWLPNIC